MAGFFVAGFTSHKASPPVTITAQAATKQPQVLPASLNITPNIKQARPILPAQPVNIDINALWQGTNDQRAQNGLAALTLDPLLNKSAQLKCDDMVAKDYWQHNAPDGTEPWAFMQRAGVQYSAGAENLAYGFSGAGAVISGWMNSPGHRANMLGDYTNVGFGICNSPNYVGNGPQTIIVQHFTW
jgi:uncharacterized protein YkwD